jgi:hypothetical protein
MNNVVQFNRAPARLDKKQLASHLGVSTRWVELRMAEGLPSLPRASAQEKARFDVAAVERWVANRPHVMGHRESHENRIAALEQQVASLLNERKAS